MTIVSLEKKYILQTYKRQDVVFVRGKDKYLWDINRKKYLDFFTGISVCNMGHGHNKITAAIKKQCEKLVHVSNHYYTGPQSKLAELIINKSFKKGKVFLSNSGAEANECAIKLARRHGNPEGKYEIISFNNSFHGRTMATLSATGQKKFHQYFNPFLSGFKFAKLNNISSVKKLINKRTCAVLIEPIQGEGGVCAANRKFLQELRALCNKNKLLLIFDEIQCGLGRTGRLFAYQYYGVEPDVMTLAKSIANGLPLGITVVKDKYSDVLAFGGHGSTFGGNLVSCAAAIETLNLISGKKVLDNVVKTGDYFYKKLTGLKNKYPGIIKEARGAGLMLGIELVADSGAGIVEKCLKKGLIINCTQSKILRFLPPFTITKKDVDSAIRILSECLR
ncbi:MAG: aspartate aminotransferase family protein [Elusimicrobia bacterium]|nr:aspartate aminotransferase family protein [Elusimicrobiota bacterium]MBU2614789.1 aspartate aminotransferase family protein [Elusimicrobiota bacterium]